MQVNVTFRHLEPSDMLKAFAKERVEKVRKYLDHASEANVILSIEKHMHHVEVLVRSGPFYLRSREKSDDMYASIGLAMDKIERQLKRYKERLRTFKRTRHDQNALRVRHEIIEATLSSEEVEATPESTPSKVLETKELVAERMSVDEAVLQLELAEQAFLVFTNAATGQVAVLYRRDDGRTFGLIDARPNA